MQKITNLLKVYELLLVIYVVAQLFPWFNLFRTTVHFIFIFYVLYSLSEIVTKENKSQTGLKNCKPRKI